MTPSLRSRRLVISSPNTNSHALKLLADELSKRVGYKVWRVTPERVRGRSAVRFLPGIDKVQQFQSFHRENVSAPGFATSLDAARDLETELVVVRALTGASEGAGISIVPRDSLTAVAPLYTAYIKKKKEFRVHVWNNEVIDVQEKRRKNGVETSKVRNTANGYVFCRTDVHPPPGIDSLAVAAVASLNRSYGGVDIIWNEHRDQCYVLEVNSRPGLEGSTVSKYADAILKGESLHV
jgi:hypothetical protein